MPGALITPACYDLLIQGIQRAGCHVEIASLAGSNPPNPDESTAAIDSKDLLDRYLVPLIEAGKDVMMFAHFFGATCLSGALDKASTAERTAIGQAGSVIGIVRISTALVPDGQSQVGYLRGGWPPFCKLDYPPPGMFVFDPVIETLFNGAKPAAAETFAKSYTPHAIKAFDSPVSTPL